MHHIFLLLLFLPLALTQIPPEYDFWWTALGDSYASGVGSGKYLGGRRCLRYDQAYPVQMQGNSDLGYKSTPTEKRLFQNVVCSGAEVDDVDKYQLLDSDTSGIPNWTYGPRPRFGEPSVATLSIGGDDIDFPGILFNCILQTSLPFVGPTFRSCEDQRMYSWSKLNDPSLITNISTLIGRIVTKAQQGQAGTGFKLYVTGYGQFFNSDTTLCNDVTFARTAYPTPDGKSHQKMTQEIRQEFNQMSLGLNTAIQQAVAQHVQNGVKYIDIDSPLTGHRFCEEGVNEPDQNNPNLWLWHYPYNQPDHISTTGVDYTSVFEAANANAFGKASTNASSAQYSSGKAVHDAFYDSLDLDEMERLVGVKDADSWDFWGGVVGYRAKVFHPQVAWHSWIQNAVVAQWKQDTDVDGTGATATNTIIPKASSSAALPPPTWSLTFQSYTANLPSGSFSFFVLPGPYNNAFSSSKRSLEEGEGEETLIDAPSSHPHYKRAFPKRKSPSVGKRLSKEHPPHDSSPTIGKRRIPPEPGVLPVLHPAQVYIWTQSGSGATSHGPFDLDCSEKQDVWQSFSPSETGLEDYLMIQSGHACAFDWAEDGNLDNLHVKYAAQYQDVSDGLKSGQCVEHDNGVTCNAFTVS